MGWFRRKDRDARDGTDAADAAGQDAVPVEAAPGTAGQDAVPVEAAPGTAGQDTPDKPGDGGQDAVPVEAATGTAGQDAPDKPGDGGQDAAPEIPDTAGRDTPDRDPRLADMRSITDRLESVRKEYADAVSLLMDTKKELHAKRREIEFLAQRHENVSKRLESTRTQQGLLDAEIARKKDQSDELGKADVVLAEVKDEIAKYQSDADRARKSALRHQSELDKIIARRRGTESELHDIDRRLREARGDLEGTLTEIKARQAEAAMAGKAGFAGQIPSDKKHLVEAASAVVASATQKLKSAQKELEVAKKALERERAEHAATRKELDVLRAQDSR